jgi:hypothetical protein
LDATGPVKMGVAIKKPANIPKPVPSPPMSMTVIVATTLKITSHFLAVEVGIAGSVVLTGHSVLQANGIPA